MLKDRLHYNDCSITDSCWHAQSIEQGRECCVTVEWLLSSDLLGGGRIALLKWEVEQTLLCARLLGITEFVASVYSDTSANE